MYYFAGAWEYPPGSKSSASHLRTTVGVAVNKDDVQNTERAIAEMSSLCQGRDGIETTSELLTHLNRIFMVGFLISYLSHYGM